MPGQVQIDPPPLPVPSPEHGFQDAGHRPVVGSIPVQQHDRRDPVVVGAVAVAERWAGPPVVHGHVRQLEIPANRIVGRADAGGHRTGRKVIGSSTRLRNIELRW
ncbi:MAG: hypothetical protein ACRDRH_13160 [Pseudonocardia sp.]